MGAKISRLKMGGQVLQCGFQKAIAEQWGVQEGSSIEILPGDNQIVMRRNAV